MYIVLFATIGAASWPRTKPVENVDTTRRLRTFVVLISARLLKRVDAKSFAGRTHCPSSAGSESLVRGRVVSFATSTLPVDRDGSVRQPTNDAISQPPPMREAKRSLCRMQGSIDAPP